jgi:hypothetical protein
LFSLRIGEPTTRSVQGAVAVLAERARVPKNIAMCVCSRQGSNRIAASCSLACTLMMASDRSSETERGAEEWTERRVGPANQGALLRPGGCFIYGRSRLLRLKRSHPCRHACNRYICQYRWPNDTSTRARHGLGTAVPAVPCLAVLACRHHSPHYGRAVIPRVPGTSPRAKNQALGEGNLPRVLH